MRFAHHRLLPEYASIVGDFIAMLLQSLDAVLITHARTKTVTCVISHKMCPQTPRSVTGWMIS